jgi:hypothetical protein
MKNINLLILLLTLFCLANLSASTNFGKRIEGMEQALSVSSTSDGGMIISGTSTQSDSTIIVKTTANGSEEWRKYFEGFEFSPSERFDNYHSDIEQTQDGGYILINTIEITGAAVQVHKLSSNGEIEWSKNYDNDGDDFSREVLYTTDKGYLFLFTNDSTTYMQKTDSEGNDQWINTETITGFTSYDLQIRQTADNGYIYCRKRDLVKYDMDGNEEWRQGYKGVLRSKVEEFASGGYIVIHRTGRIERTNAIGDTLWQIKKLPRLDDFTIDKNDNIIVVGEKLIKLDTLANIIWEKDLPFENIKDIYTESDGRIILVGQLKNSGGFVAKYSPEGESDFLILSRPQDGERLIVNKNYIIEWVSSGYGEILIEWTNEYQNDWVTLTQIQDTLSGYNWETPGNQSYFNKIRLSSITKPEVFDQNYYTFSFGAKHQDYIAINEILMHFSSDGTGSANSQMDYGLLWPGGKNATQSSVLKDGMTWAGIINESDTIANGNWYKVGMQPGNILSNGIAAEPNDPNIGIYKIRPDWESLPAGPVKQRLEYDWKNWPIKLGAPWIDKNTDGVYNWQIDKPEIIGDEYNWMVFNDLDSSKSAYGSAPVGIEVRLSIWGFNQTTVLKDVVFKKYQIFNKSHSHINEMYLGYFSDPDLGFAGDDLAGCDTSLNLAFIWNGAQEDRIYGPNPPAWVTFFFRGRSNRGQWKIKDCFLANG